MSIGRDDPRTVFIINEGRGHYCFIPSWVQVAPCRRTIGARGSSRWWKNNRLLGENNRCAGQQQQVEQDVVK